MKEKTEQTYQLSCLIKFFSLLVNDNGRSYERTLVLLIPRDSDERTRFLTAWLPEVSSEHHELVGTIPPPVDSPSRFSIHRANERCDRHHILVMSKGVEDIIRQNFKEGDVLPVSILPEADDEVADQMKDSDGSYDLISGQESF